MTKSCGCSPAEPFRFVLHMSQALLTAFSTASSKATLPVTIECAVENARVSRQSVDFCAVGRLAGRSLPDGRQYLR